MKTSRVFTDYGSWENYREKSDVSIVKIAVLVSVDEKENYYENSGLSCVGSTLLYSNLELIRRIDVTSVR